MAILDRQPSAAEPPDKPRRDRTHWLYIAVIVAVFAGVAVGPSRPRGRQERRSARHHVRRTDQDDDRARHLLHDRPGHRLGTQSRYRRQGRRVGIRLLPDHVDVRARDRSAGRQPHPPRQRHAPDRHRRRQGRRVGRNRTRIRRTARLRPGHHPGHPVLVADNGQRAAGSVRRASRRLRAASHGHRR